MIWRVSSQSCSTLSLCGVLVHHVVIAILVYKMYVRVPLFFCLGVIGKIDGDGVFSEVVNTEDYFTDDESIAQ